MRPLGYGLNTDKSFGYGTLLFSWRNVPFNTPLVFGMNIKGGVLCSKGNGVLIKLR